MHDVAPGVRSITVGGHAAGQSVLEVQTKDGPVVLASDAFHFYEEYELRRPFAICADLVGALRAFDVLRELSRRRARPDAGRARPAGHGALRAIRERPGRPDREVGA